MNLVKKMVVLCLPCFILACSTRPAPEKEILQPLQPESIVKPKKLTKAIEADKPATAPAALKILLKRAQQQLSNNNTQAAEASLERAIRIAPRYPGSYLRLAELRYKQALYQQSAALAEKALSLGAVGKLRKLALSLLEQSSKSK